MGKNEKIKEALKMLRGIDNVADYITKLEKVFEKINEIIDEPDYERIKCAAIRYKDKIITGYRHDDCFRNLGMFKVPEEKWSDYEQGFVDFEGKFYTREEAAELAFNKGQIRHPIKTLFSEDLY